MSKQQKLNLLFALTTVFNIKNIYQMVRLNLPSPLKVAEWMNLRAASTDSWPSRRASVADWSEEIVEHHCRAGQLFAHSTLRVGQCSVLKAKKVNDPNFQIMLLFSTFQPVGNCGQVNFTTFLKHTEADIAIETVVRNKGAASSFHKILSKISIHKAMAGSPTKLQKWNFVKVTRRNCTTYPNVNSIDDGSISKVHVSFSCVFTSIKADIGTV